MPLRDNELARRQEGRLELRPQPLRVRWSFGELLTRDGHELRAIFSCSVRALPDATERRMLQEVLMGSKYSLSDDDVANHFEAALQAAAQRAAEKHTAAEWSGDDSIKNEMIEALQSAARPVAFGCGLELLPPFNLDLQSPSYQRQRLRAMQQELAEQQTAGQIGHMQRAAGLLKQFQQIREAAPDLSPGRVLQQISASDRGAVLQTLLLASAKEEQATRLWTVAGPYLVRIDARSEPPGTQLFPLPPVLGPLRSVQPADVDGQRRLLVGARGGFLLIDPENPVEPRLFHNSGIESQLGFSRVVFWSDRQGFVASHGDAGIVGWALDEPGEPKSILGPDRLGVREPISAPSASGGSHTSGPRNLQVLDGTAIVFSAGSTLFLSDSATAQLLPTESPAEIVGIVPDDRQLVVVHADGTLCSLDRSTRKLTCLSRRGVRVRSAGALPWVGTTRVLLASEDGPVDCVGFDDQLLTQYSSPHRGLRAVAGSTDLVAGISGDRQRLILWNSWDGRQPLGEIYLAGLTRHRIADVDFG
jgi:hypothetical protein